MADSLAGIPFIAVAHHDLRFFRSPGVYVMSRRHGSQRTILFVGHADEVSAVYGGRTWNAALQVGMNEALVNLAATERLDRLQIVTMVVRAYKPQLNDTAEGSPSAANLDAKHRRDSGGL